MADVRSAFLHVGVDTRDQAFLGFTTLGRYFRPKVTLFGLAHSPYYWHKVSMEEVKALRSEGHRVVMYVDDLAYMAQSDEGYVALRQRIIDLFEEKGIMLAMEKLSPLTPSQQIRYLGVEVNSAPYPVFSIPADKLEEIKESARRVLRISENGRRKVFARELKSLVGKVNAVDVALPHGRIHSRPIHSNLGSAYGLKRIKLVPQAVEEIEWFSSLSLHPSVTSRPATAHVFTRAVEVWSDASKSGWGAVLSTEAGPLEINGSWSSQQRQLSINRLELN